MDQFEKEYQKVREKGVAVKNKTVKNIKTHWIDYVLIFAICFVLGAFDVFVLQKSSRLGDAEYWYHAGCRFISYILAGILGIRMGYPKFKESSQQLAEALYINDKLLRLRSADFAGYIEDVINVEIKTAAWKNKITKKIQRLDIFYPNYCKLFYFDKNEKYFGDVKSKRLEKRKKRAAKYAYKRSELEKLIDDKYITDNFQTLKVRYRRVNEKDFGNIEDNIRDTTAYKTRSNKRGNSARTIASSLILTALFTFIFGSFALSFNEALAQERILAIFTIIINSILDIGLTLWRFVSAYSSCERIVREEDLQVANDQNRIMFRYFEFKGIDVSKIKTEYVKEN